MQGETRGVTMTVAGATAKCMTVIHGTHTKRHTQRNGTPPSAKKNVGRNGWKKNANKSDAKKLPANAADMKPQWRDNKRKKNCIASSKRNTIGNNKNRTHENHRHPNDARHGSSRP